MFKNQKARWMAPEEQHLQLLLVPTCTIAPHACTPHACTPHACTPHVCTPHVCTPHACTHRRKGKAHMGEKSLQNTLLIVVWWPKFMKKNLKTQKYKNNKMERSELIPNQESCTSHKTSRDAQGRKSWRVTLKQRGAPHICQNAQQHQMLTRTGSSRNSCYWESNVHPLSGRVGPLVMELMLLLTIWSNCGVPGCLSQRNCRTEMCTPCL